MKRDEVEELLLQWEIARQEGREISASLLCENTPHLEEVLKECILVLQKTSWMLDDPAADILDAELVSHVSGLVGKAETLATDSTGRSQVEGDRERDGPLAPPRPSVPGFSLVSEIGRGGFGVVYDAIDDELNRRVAIKLPLVDNPRFHDKYIREARNAALLDVPGIVPVLQVGRTSEGCPFVVQKLIQGMSLAEVLGKGGRLSAVQTIAIMLGVCKSVGAAHAQSLVHRDLKPANILIDECGTPWVSDLGLAIMEEDQPFHKGEVAGTPSYMAPEQFQGKVDWLDGRTDIWALGVILYQCLTGTLPFKAPVRSQLQRQILEQDARPICQRVPQLQPQWDAVFQKCCAKMARDRYKSALELASDLNSLAMNLEHTSEHSGNRVLLDLQPSESVTQIQSSLDQGISKRQRSRFGLWGMTVSAVILLAIAGTLVVRQVLPEREGDKSLQVLDVDPQGERPNSESGDNVSLLVSAESNGTHQTLKDAIAAALPGQEILVAAGVYRESLQLSGDVTIRSQSGNDKVSIVGVDGPAFIVAAGAALSLTGMSVAVESNDNSNINSIEVHGGALVLNECDVSASTYDCVRLSPKSKLSAEACRFRSTRHPAIYANKVEQLEVRKCQFELNAELDEPDNLILVGIQAKQSGGTISECTFSGSQATAIEWGDSPEPVVVSDCTFEDLKHGFMAFACEQLRLGGLQKSSFERCEVAIAFQSCGGTIDNCIVDGGKLPGSTGIRVRGIGVSDRSSVTIRSCSLNGLESPILLSQASVQATLLTVQDASDCGVLLVDDSHLEMTESKIVGSAVFGMLLESSDVRLERCEIVNSGVAGIVVDGLENAFESDGCWINENAVGVILMSGSIRMHHGEVQENDTGILVARKHLLNHERTCDAELQVVADHVSFSARIRALQFLSPGSYQLSRCTLLDPAQGIPLLADGLSESVVGATTVVLESQP